MSCPWCRASHPEQHWRIWRTRVAPNGDLGFGFHHAMPIIICAAPPDEGLDEVDASADDGGDNDDYAEEISSRVAFLLFVLYLMRLST